MDARNYLRQIHKLETRISMRQRQIKDLRRSMAYLHSVDYSADRVQTSPSGAGFTTDAIRAKIPDAKELDGPEDIAAWNRGEIRVLLAHPASVGYGLNLQDGGHVIVWYGLTWSLELYQQANARLHRQGQSHPVIIHHLLAAGTVDEQVMRALKAKDTSQAALLAALKERRAE